MRKVNSYQVLGASVIGLLGVVLFAAKSVFVKMAYEYHADAISVLYLRMLFAFPLVLIVGLIYEKTKNTVPFRWMDILKVAGISVFGYYISAVFDFAGLIYVEASIERLVLFLYPTMVIILSMIFLKKPITAKQVIAISVSYIGLLIAFGNKLIVHASPGFWFGISLILVSAITYAVFLTISDKLIKQVGSVRFSTVATLTMCFCIIVHANVTGKGTITGFPSQVYISCILMAVLSTVIPVYMFNYAMSQLGASNISIISCFGPVCTLFLSAMMLKEVITLWQIAGTLIVVGGVLLINKEDSEKQSWINRLGIMKPVFVPITWIKKHMKQ